MDFKRGTMSRRGFIQRSLTGLAAVGIPTWFGNELVASAEQAQPAQPVAPNDAIVMGHIGCGNPVNGRGRHIGNEARKVNGVQYVACCDVDRTHRESWAQYIAPGRQIAQFNDFRELLARRDIQAVTIATVDHWHALVAIAAMKAGKDVYCEKPLTLTIEEGKALVRVARETNRRLQVGSQQRTEFAGRFRLACDLVRNGRIGRITRIDCRIGDNPVGGPFQVSAVPAGLDWDFWLGPTPRVDYVRQKCHYDFRWWYDYSGGKMTDWGAHHLDTAQCALNMDASGPVEVEGSGDAPDGRPLTYNCHPQFTATYRYANGTIVTATSRGENGLHFTGEDGKWLFVSRNALRASDAALINEPLPASATRLPVHLNHMQNFIDCVRSRQQPICNQDVGHRSTTVCHIGTIAIRSGQRLRWNPQTERFDGTDAFNNQWLGRPMRAPWRLDA
ncbi:MAG TPA: Gfo/Idh/MocA family oxidoreductase [Gemmataceae bacterium]|nr:Gfo/Idh/MocA family oxidoreductase [Gemmataceae bacterium]